MTTQPNYDVAIVGASIGGCTAAILLARAGLQVALIERQADPQAHKAICTHLIQPSAAPTIARLGLAPAILAAGGLPNSLAMWTRWGWIADDPSGSGETLPHGYNIRRQLLDPLLRRAAIDTPGVTFLPGHTARALVTTASGAIGGVTVQDSHGQTTTLTAQLTIGADGRNSRVAELAQVPAQERPNRRFSYFAYYRNLPLASGQTSQLWMLEPDAAYAFPNDDGLTLLAHMGHRNRLADFKRDREGNFTAAFANLPDGPSLANAERVSPILGMVDIPNISRRPAQPGLALIGDAALASDPLWGVGCGWAFQSAEWLADAVAPALAARHGLDRALQTYRRRHRAALSGHHFLIADYSTGRPFNPIERLLFSAAAKDTASALHVGRFGYRLIGPRQFLAPRALARAIRVNLTRRTPLLAPGHAFTP
ncbi:MAG: NAD(P)/FAD-dependent oxidoreductase [Thermomicrobiales bacterium]